ncbi:MAG TPA: zf-TFIIB domain-containing protein [Candidatus Acidoferrum sp.]|nr:zf-TFIIB domain-containing protein [Candidatus Acidoferrum sp.]
MADDNKDRLGGKLHDVEAARESQWARQRDEELLEKMRKRLHHHACPECKEFLVPKIERGVPVQACPNGHGAWLDEPTLKTVLKEQK